MHGYEEDKSEHLEIFSGALESAPMVRQCPVSLECRLKQTVELPHDFLFIGEVVNVYASESVLTDGKIDVVKLRPFVLTMPGNAFGPWASTWAGLGDRQGPPQVLGGLGGSRARGLEEDCPDGPRRSESSQHEVSGRIAEPLVESQPEEPRRRHRDHEPQRVYQTRSRRTASPARASARAPASCSPPAFVTFRVMQPASCSL